MVQRLLRASLLALCLIGSACAANSQWRAHDGADLPLSTEVDFVAHSPAWDGTIKQAYDSANDYITRYTSSAHRPRGSWAVVMDLDQTVLNNIEYHKAMSHAGKTHNADDWKNWAHARRAVLMPYAKDFIARVNALGGHVAFVTNRRDYEQLATEENLAKLGLMRSRDFRVLLTRASPHGSASKDSRFALVRPMLAAQGYANVRVIAYLGDAMGDKPARLNGAQFFCIPQGGMYGENC